MARLITRSKPRLIYIVITMLVLVMLVLGEFVLDWPSPVISIGVGLVSVANLVVLMKSIKGDGAQHG